MKIIKNIKILIEILKIYIKLTIFMLNKKIKACIIHNNPKLHHIGG